MLSLFIFLLKLNSFLFQIIIPFSTIKDNITTDSPPIFMFFYFPNKIETKIKIGTPYQEISLRLKTLLSPLSINSVKMGTINIVRFNESNSSSYISLNDTPTFFGEYGFINAIKSKDTINFNSKLILNNLTFLLGLNENLYRKESGILGLNIPEFDKRIQEIGIIKQLKQRDLIQKYTYYIKYNETNDEGDLIIGSLPHEINSQKYDEKKYDEFNAELVSSTMGLKVTESYYGETLMDCEFKVELAVEENFIRGTEAIKNILHKQFFEEKISNNICQRALFSYIDNENVYFYYCSKELNLSEFKNITLYIDGSDLKIELSYNDLFYEYKDNYYLMMYFPLQSYSHYFFRLGKILFKKYILVFNHDDKKIGYYRKDYKKEDKKEENKNEEDKKGDNKFFSQWLFQWIIIGILVIIVGLLSFIIIYYKPWKYRAKRANELQDDDYCYQGINSDGKLNIN